MTMEYISVESTSVHGRWEDEGEDWLLVLIIKDYSISESESSFIERKNTTTDKDTVVIYK